MIDARVIEQALPLLLLLLFLSRCLFWRLWGGGGSSSTLPHLLNDHDLMLISFICVSFVVSHGIGEGNRTFIPLSYFSIGRNIIYANEYLYNSRSEYNHA